MEVAEQILDGYALQLGVLLEGSVELGGVASVVLPMVDLHGAGVDVRLESGEVVRQDREA